MVSQVGSQEVEVEFRRPVFARSANSCERVGKEAGVRNGKVKLIQSHNCLDQML